MTYLQTRRLHHMFGKKISRFFMYRKAKKMYNEIDKGINELEIRMRFKGGHL